MASNREKKEHRLSTSIMELWATFFQLTESILVRVVGVIFLTVVGVLIGGVLWEHWHFSGSPIVGAVFLSLLGGLWLGVVSTIVLGVATDFFYLPPLYTAFHLPYTEATQRLYIAIFLALGIGALSSSLRTAFKRLNQAKQEAERAKQETERAKQEAESALREVRETQERFALATDGARVGVWEANLETGEVHVTDVERILYGLDQKLVGRLTQKDLLAKIHPEDRPLVGEALKLAITQKGGYQSEFRVIHPDGTLRWLVGRGRVFLDPQGNASRIFGVNWDVTERKHTEQALRDLAARLEAAVRARDEVVGIISHELKNPLTALQTGVTLIEKVFPKSPENENARKLIERLRPSIKRMGLLVSDLLDVTRLEAGALKLEPRNSNLLEIAEEVVRTYETAAMVKKLDLSVVDIPVEARDVLCDPSRTSQILSNLVNNAIKFTDEGGSVRISAKKASDHIEVRVTDTGKGISKEHLPHIFDRFWQAKETAYKGTGLGLSIAKGLVEAQGGRIWVESRLGAGSTFFITIPLAASEIKGAKKTA